MFDYFLIYCLHLRSVTSLMKSAKRTQSQSDNRTNPDVLHIFWLLRARWIAKLILSRVAGRILGLCGPDLACGPEVACP